MTTWNLHMEKLDALTLAADARLGKVDYCNDQIWELRLVGGDPACLALQTTFGLRARGFQMFPQFVDGSTTINDPRTFEQPPILNWAYPNFARVTYSPFKDIEVVSEYWVPDSHSIAGRLQITNQGTIPRQIRLELVAMLTPGDEGRRMAATKMHGVWVLSGATEGLALIIFMWGGVEAGNIPYPTVYLAAMLRPGEAHDFVWAQASLADPEASFELARQTVSRNWDAERARIQMNNASQVEIETGDPEWNTAFALTQQIALGLLVSSQADVSTNENLPAPSLVFNRQA